MSIEIFWIFSDKFFFVFRDMIVHCCYKSFSFIDVSKVSTCFRYFVHLLIIIKLPFYITIFPQIHIHTFSYRCHFLHILYSHTEKIFQLILIFHFIFCSSRVCMQHGCGVAMWFSWPQKCLQIYTSPVYQYHFSFLSLSHFHGDSQHY